MKQGTETQGSMMPAGQMEKIHKGQSRTGTSPYSRSPTKQDLESFKHKGKYFKQQGQQTEWLENLFLGQDLSKTDNGQKGLM